LNYLEDFYPGDESLTDLNPQRKIFRVVKTFTFSEIEPLLGRNKGENIYEQLKLEKIILINSSYRESHTKELKMNAHCDFCTSSRFPVDEKETELKYRNKT